MGVAGECDNLQCPVSPHAATSWCLQATGAPVLAVTTIICPPGDGSTGASVILIDPETGNVVAPQAIVACGDKDWEVNQLCDYDPATGALIATFIQVFEWDEDTGVLLISNVRADNPTVVYVPVGIVRACTDDETAIDVEVTSMCYDVEGTVVQGWQAWVFLNGVHSGANLYYDADGVTLVAPSIVECPDPATEATLAAILLAVADLDVNTDGLEACCTAGNVLLGIISGNIIDIETLLTAIGGSVDGLEACCTASNVLLTAIAGHVDGIEGLLTSILATLTASERKIDGDDKTGAGSIVIPDGVYSWALTVRTAGAGVTISGPDFTSGTVAVYTGQSIGHSADGKNNTLNGPITITTTAGSEVNATWVKA